MIHEIQFDEGFGGIEKYKTYSGKFVEKDIGGIYWTFTNIHLLDIGNVVGHVDKTFDTRICILIFDRLMTIENNENDDLLEIGASLPQDMEKLVIVQFFEPNL